MNAQDSRLTCEQCHDTGCISNTVDELVLQRVETKREVQDILLDAMKLKGYK